MLHFCAHDSALGDYRPEREPQNENPLLLFLFLNAQTPMSLNERSVLDRMSVCPQARCTGRNGDSTRDADPRPVVPSCDPAPHTLHASLPHALNMEKPRPLLFLPARKNPCRSGSSGSRSTAGRLPCPGSMPQCDSRHPSSPLSPLCHSGFSTLNISTLLLVLRELNSSCSDARRFSPGSKPAD